VNLLAETEGCRTDNRALKSGTEVLNPETESEMLKVSLKARLRRDFRMPRDDIETEVSKAVAHYSV
jgi:hypothetical protein